MRFETAVGGSDGLDVGHAERRLDEGFGADLVREALGDLDLADDGLDRVDVGRHADLRDEDGVELERRPARTMSTTSRYM